MARNPHAKPNPTKVAEEQVRVYTLRLQGRTVRQIAAELGMARSTVQDRLDSEIRGRVQPVAEEVRALELDRLDSYLARLERQLEEGEAPERIVPVALRVGERRARLLGLDAPVKTESDVTVNTDEDVAALLARARGVRG